MSTPPFTPYPDVNALLEDVVARMRAILGGKLVGVYLYGSLTTGDFTPEVSDFDLLAALADRLDVAEFAALDAMHLDVMARNPAWDNRVEIGYLTVEALHTFKTRRSEITIISPGEPFHTKEAGIDWLINWYMVRERGVTLFGQPPSEVIAPISHVEFLDAVRNQMQAWREWSAHIDSRPYQSYSILTMCRGLYALAHGEQGSKPRAAQWAMVEYPAWADLITRALAWRLAHRERDVDHGATLAETLRFVYFAIDQAAVEHL